MTPSRLNTTLLAIIACMLWSTAFVGIKIGLAYTTPIHFAGVRFLIAGLLLIPFTGHPAASLAMVRRHWRFVARIGILYTALMYAAFYLGIGLASASTTAIVVGGGPLFVSLLAHFAMPDDRITPIKAGALSVGMTGILMIAISRYSVDWETGKAFWGVLLLVTSNLLGGVSNIMIARSRRDIPPLVLSSAQLVVGGAILLVASLFLESSDVSSKPLAYYGALTYLSFLSAAAISIWFVLLQRPGVKVSKLNVWKFLIPVFGAVFSWTFLKDDHPDPIAVVGMCCIAVSLVLVHLHQPARWAGKAS